MSAQERLSDSRHAAARRDRFVWRACCLLILLLTAVCFSPLVQAWGALEPRFLGLPRTLWSSIAIALVMLGTTFVGGLFHPDRHEDEGDDG